MESGILYVVFNKWIRNPETNEIPYKIGITKGSVYDRYYGLGLKMPGKFEAQFAYQLEDCTKAEQYIQGILYKHRENGEWFNIGQNELDLIKRNCEAMGGILITDEVKNEIEIETEEKTIDDAGKASVLVHSHILGNEKPINPNRPCKIFVFPIQNNIAKGYSVYDSTRMWWKITEKYRDTSEYEFAVGLQRGISLGSFKIKEWIPNPEETKCKFEGEEIPDFTGFSWYKQIGGEAKGYWLHGNHLVVEFDGKGNFRIKRPNYEQWINCL
jgi:hypothetical protein